MRKITQDHPRLRGENSSTETDMEVVKGSPPLARGKHRSYRVACVARRITPACAGKTRRSIYVRKITQDHPRLRGENSSTETDMEVVKGSPPLARGKHRSYRVACVARRITPACAGKTLKNPCI